MKGSSQGSVPAEVFPCRPESQHSAGGRERPSQHGVILGELLAAMADAGRLHAPELPDMCATCAFRPGCMTNQMAATGLTALNCVLGIDTDRFACHHGMTDGRPAKLCAGYIAARLAPFEFTKAAMGLLMERLSSLTGPDEVREAFDGWIAEVDPDNRMNDYERGRAYLRSFQNPQPSEAAPSGVAPLLPREEQ